MSRSAATLSWELARLRQGETLLRAEGLGFRVQGLELIFLEFRVSGLGLIF